MSSKSPKKFTLSESDIDEFKSQTAAWAKRAGAKLVHTEANGNVEVWEYGKSQSRNRTTRLYGSAIDTHFTGWKYDTYEKIAEEIIKFAIERLKTDFSIREDLHLRPSKSGCSTLYYYLISDDFDYKEDDLPVLLAQMITLAEYSLDSKRFSEEFRMTQAFRLGKVEALYYLYLDKIPKNRRNASHPKDPLGTSILIKLCKVELPQSELWEEFKSQLRNHGAEVIEHEPNAKQPTTWSITYNYFAENGKEIVKPLKYKSFKSRISKLKNS